MVAGGRANDRGAEPLRLLQCAGADGAGGSVQQNDIVLRDVGDVQHLRSSGAHQKQIGGLGKVEARGLGEHFRRVHRDGGGVSAQDLEGHHLVPDRAATRGQAGVWAESGHDSGYLVAQRQGQQVSVLARADVLVVGGVHASRSDLDGRLPPARRVQFDRPLL